MGNKLATRIGTPLNNKNTPEVSKVETKNISISDTRNKEIGNDLSAVIPIAKRLCNDDEEEIINSLGNFTRLTSGSIRRYGQLRKEVSLVLYL